MLQVVLGLEADRIAAAFLVKPSAMAQRLVRAKRKLRDAGIRFAMPEREDLSSRVPPVLDAIYAAFGAGWDAVTGGESTTVELVDEAIWLARVVVDALPEHAEALGLLSLMRYCDARRAARLSAQGAYRPLDQQDPATWDLGAIAEAETTLVRAARLLSPGRYQTEAAIQSLQVARRRGAPVDGDTLITLYDALWTFAPTIGVAVARAAAVAQEGHAAVALAQLDTLPADGVRQYQPWWAVRAHALAALGDREQAREAYDIAIGLSMSSAIRDFLLQRRAMVTA
jgi:RNA polymerase sigma-70 factor (ECF subfamily)